jgi:peptidoglycan/xylan/chitin deacetylase (PgdA/CDA1 family)
MRANRWGAAAAAAGGIAYRHSVSPTSQLYGRTICRVPAAPALVALTFDDGPNLRSTEPLLELLERYGAPATFFVIGRFAAAEPGLVRELAARGHAVGNHTFSHPHLPRRAADAVRDELARTRAAVEAAGVRFSAIDGRELMRPPYGHRRPGTLRVVGAAGYVPVMWSITCFDWRRTATARAIARRGSRARHGDIVLLHDGSNHGVDVDRSRTVAATERILDRLGDDGYGFATVPQLAAAGDLGSA